MNESGFAIYNSTGHGQGHVYRMLRVLTPLAARQSRGVPMFCGYCGLRSKDPSKNANLLHLIGPRRKSPFSPPQRDTRDVCSAEGKARVAADMRLALRIDKPLQSLESPTIKIEWSVPP